MFERRVYDFVQASGKCDVRTLPWAVALMRCETQERLDSLKPWFSSMTPGDNDSIFNEAEAIDQNFAKLARSAFHAKRDKMMPNFDFENYIVALVIRFLHLASYEERAYISTNAERLLDHTLPVDAAILTSSDYGSGKAHEYASAIVNGTALTISDNNERRNERIEFSSALTLVNGEHSMTKVNGLTFYTSTGEAWIGGRLITSYDDINAIQLQSEEAFNQLISGMLVDAPLPAARPDSPQMF